MCGRPRQPFRGQPADPEDWRDGRQQAEREQDRGPGREPPEQNGQDAGHDAERDQVEQPLPQVDDHDGRRGHAAARAENRRSNRNLPEQERRQQQAEPGEIADVSVADGNAHLRPPQQEDPSQAAQHQAGDGQGRSRGEPDPETRRARVRPAAELREDERRADQAGDQDSRRRCEQQHPGDAPLAASAALLGHDVVAASRTSRMTYVGFFCDS